MSKYVSKLSFDFLFKVFFLGSLIFVILFFIADFFTVYYRFSTETFIFLDERRIFLENNLLKIFGGITLLIISIIIIKLKGNTQNYLPDKYITILLVTFTVFYLFGNSTIRPMFFFGLAMTVFIYNFVIKITQDNSIQIDYLWIKKIIIYTLVIYTVTPLLIYIIHSLLTFEKYFAFEFIPQLYIVDSFRGFTLDRIQYSFLVGILMLFLLFKRKDIENNKIILLILIIGLFLAISRASILALIIALIFYNMHYHRKKKKRLITFFISIFFFIIIAYFFSNRVDVLSDGGDRLSLLAHSIHKIFENGYISFLIGNGDFYTTYLNGLYPHNAILQSVMDFGMIVTTLWLVVLYRFFYILNIKAKTMFIYISTFGMFHPNFSAFTFMPITVFAYVCVLLLNFRKENNIQ